MVRESQGENGCYYYYCCCYCYYLLAIVIYYYYYYYYGKSSSQVVHIVENICVFCGWLQMNADARYLLELMNNLQSTYNDDSHADQYTVYHPVKGNTISLCVSLGQGFKNPGFFQKRPNPLDFIGLFAVCEHIMWSIYVIGFM